MSSSSVKIHQANSQFDNESISMTRPVVVQGGTYFTKIRCNKSNTPYYVQFEPCKTKQGVVNTNKRSYIDLLYNNEDVEILEWFENLQDTIITKIYDHKNEWFQSDMERTDIENNFVNITKSFRGGKHHLIRVGMNTPNEPRQKGKECVVFDEYENVITIEGIQENDNIEGILEVQGVRFTSKSFQVELMCKQLKISQKESTFDKCMIRSSRNTNNTNNTNTEESRSSDHEILISPTPTTSIPTSIPTSTQETSTDNIETVVKTEDNHESFDSVKIDEFPHTVYDEVVSQVTNDIITSVEDTINASNTKPSVSENNDEKNVQGEVEEEEESGMFSENTENDKEVDTESKVTKTIVFKEEEELIIDTPGIEKHVGDLELDMNDRTDSKNVIEDVNGTSDLTDISSNFENEIHVGGTVTSLKDPQEIYYEIYKVAKQKAREHKVKSITHYLEAKNIKNQYLLDDLDESEPDDDINDYYYDSDITNQSIDNENYQIEESG